MDKNNKPVLTSLRLRRGLEALFTVLVVVIILLLLRSCGGAGRSVVLEPDYAAIDIDENAVPMAEPEQEEAPLVKQGGGSVTISFQDDITYSPSTGQVSLFYQNPRASTHNVVAQVILVRGQNEYLLAQSGILEPGYQVTALRAVDGAPTVSAGGYNGKLRLLFYDTQSGERAMVDTDIPCTVTVAD